jgi:hypothetical protein
MRRHKFVTGFVVLGTLLFLVACGETELTSPNSGRPTHTPTAAAATEVILETTAVPTATSPAVVTSTPLSTVYSRQRVIKNTPTLMPGIRGTEQASTFTPATRFFSMIRIKAVCLWSCLSGPAFLCNIPAQSPSPSSNFDRLIKESPWPIRCMFRYRVTTGLLGL